MPRLPGIPPRKHSVVCSMGGKGCSPEGRAGGHWAPCRQSSHSPAGPQRCRKAERLCCTGLGSFLESGQGAARVLGIRVLRREHSHALLVGVAWVGYAPCSSASHTSLLTEEDSPADCLRDTRRQVRFLAQGPLLTIQSLVRVGGQPQHCCGPGEPRGPFRCAPGKEW